MSTPAHIGDHEDVWLFEKKKNSYRYVQVPQEGQTGLICKIYSKHDMECYIKQQNMLHCSLNALGRTIWKA